MVGGVGYVGDIVLLEILFGDRDGGFVFYFFLVSGGGRGVRKEFLEGSKIWFVSKRVVWV